MFATPVGGYQTRPLNRFTLDEIIALRSAAAGPAVSNGTIWGYVMLGLDDFEVYPTPQSADVLTAYYTVAPTPLSADADVSVLPEPYSTDCLLYGGMARAAEFSGDPDGPYYDQKFQMALAALRAHLNRKAGRLTGQFQIQNGNLRPPHDPSVDWTARGVGW